MILITNIYRHVELLIVTGGQIVFPILMFSFYFFPIIFILHITLYRNFYRSVTVAGSIFGWETLYFLFQGALLIPPVLMPYCMVGILIFNLAVSVILLYRLLYLRTFLKVFPNSKNLLIRTLAKTLVLILVATIIGFTYYYFLDQLVSVQWNVFWDTVLKKLTNLGEIGEKCLAQ